MRNLNLGVLWNAEQVDERSSPIHNKQGKQANYHQGNNSNAWVILNTSTRFLFMLDNKSISYLEQLTSESDLVL
jgi:hypothetical protein